MNVLSLFDGISCGKVALERAGVHIDNYYASEIDKYAIAVSKARHKDIIHLKKDVKICIKCGCRKGEEYGHKTISKKLYELVGNSQGVKVTVTAIREKEPEAKPTQKLRKAV